MIGLTAGTIPARAGETECGRYGEIMPGDHPRSRGGNRTVREKMVRSQGPSPLARGKPCHIAVAVALQGTIPARAGET